MRTVIVSFKLIEAMLGEVLEVVPYCQDHKNVWSPRLATILLEAGNLLDSLWKWETCTGKSGPGKKNPNIKDHFKRFGAKLAKRWVVFWGEEGERIQPFAAWDGTPVYQDLPWWKDHNAVKHERLTDKKLATLGNAVQALAGLFVAIFNCPSCWDAIWQEDWIDAGCRWSYPPNHLLGDATPLADIAAESRLFSYPVQSGSRRQLSANRPPSGSYRFAHWCERNGLSEW
jgi:hypothetical protein